MLDSLLRSLMLAGALMLTALAPSLFSERVDGAWHLQVALDQSAGSAYLRLQQDGETLHGTYQGLLGSASIRGSIRVNTFSFQMTSAGQTITYTGQIEGGTLRGACDYAGAGACTFLGTRSAS